MNFLILNVLLSIALTSAQQKSADLRISRLKGNIFQGLTGTQEFEDNIVTSSLDNSQLIRMFYRGIREVYSRLLSGTGDRHNSERFQKKVSASTKFPCQVEGFTSKKVPKSVHQLRPGGKLNKISETAVVTHFLPERYQHNSRRWRFVNICNSCEFRRAVGGFGWESRA